MKKYLIIGIFALVTACAGVPVENRIYQVEAGYTAALNILNEARRPCVDDDITNDNLCFVDDELYRKIDVIADAAEVAIEQAKLLFAAGDEAGAVDYLVIALENVTKINEIVNRVKEDF